MYKTAVQKDRLPFQFEGAATSFGGGGWAPQAQAYSYVPAYTSSCHHQLHYP